MSITLVSCYRYIIYKIKQELKTRKTSALYIKTLSAELQFDIFTVGRFIYEQC